jgi:hypothetical protein
MSIQWRCLERRKNRLEGKIDETYIFSSLLSCLGKYDGSTRISVELVTRSMKDGSNYLGSEDLGTHYCAFLINPTRR